MALNDLCLVLFMPLVNTLQVWAGPSTLFLKNRIQQKWWNVTSIIRLEETAFCLAILSHAGSLSCPLADKASCHVVTCSTGRSMWQENKGGLQPTCHEALRPQSKQFTRNWILATTTRVSKDMDLSQLSLKRLYPCERELEPEDPAEPSSNS